MSNTNSTNMNTKTHMNKYVSRNRYLFPYTIYTYKIINVKNHFVLCIPETSIGPYD